MSRSLVLLFISMSSIYLSALHICQKDSTQDEDSLWASFILALVQFILTTEGCERLESFFQGVVEAAQGVIENFHAGEFIDCGVPCCLLYDT